MIGMTISRYRIVEPFLESGSRNAFLAQDLERGNSVVLQILPANLTATVDLMARFETDIRMLARDVCPNAEVVLELGRENETAFLVLEPQHASRLLATAKTRGIGAVLGTESTEREAQRNLESPFHPGQILGDRYRMISQIGRGGMGEVWRALDLKLQLEVALKAVRRELFADPEVLEILRAEVRTARGIVSPNVCRIFDLVVHDGHELISMEYIDGHTLREELQQHSPLDLKKAQSTAAQFLSGVQAIHAAGLVHRDIKPENIMVTRAGRVVVMDFGIAIPQTTEPSRSTSGTPAYMAPEQMRGGCVDARADLFAAALVLAEMTSEGGVRDDAAREGLWQGARQTPPRLPAGPWQALLERALLQDPVQRPASAEALARALEEVTLRVAGSEGKRPYPGLSSFTTADAEYFYGREAEVEAVWKKLRHARMLGVIGASGAGKTSFIQAGLLPVMPEGWDALVCHPGANAMVPLASELVQRVEGDRLALQGLVRMDSLDDLLNAVGIWRQKHVEVLLVIDQFEELFTQNPPDKQAQFAELLGRMVAERDVHVLLSMRDDFLIQCHRYPALAPVFRDLTPLAAPTGGALRRALVQPALGCGYRFEDEFLLEEMLGEVQEERGALPLLAFTVSRLWDDRDRDNGLLRRSTYESLGGVGGALAQHAESTLERIGSKHEPLVREILRNLVTAQGTRAVRDIEELLSVFDDGRSERERAEVVLRQLVDARLLTSFEAEFLYDGVRHRTQRVEIIHESLLSAWPRLLRWRTQEADAAQFRDQLRQAARLWQERQRSEDLLWSGTAVREFQLWREHYPGGLSAIEEAFAEAMNEREERHRRRRRRVLSGLFVLMLVALGFVGVLWRQSENARQVADLEARRAEASKLYALGQIEIETNRSAAIAYALASLELNDDPAVREFALETLWRGPTARVLPGTSAPWGVDFSPDGRMLVVGTLFSDSSSVWSSRGRLLSTFQGTGYRFGADSKTLIQTWWDDSDTIRTRSVPDGAVKALLTSRSPLKVVLGTDRRTLAGRTNQDKTSLLEVWALHEDDPVFLGQRLVDGIMPNWWNTVNLVAVDAGGKRLAHATGSSVYVVPITDMDKAEPIHEESHSQNVIAVTFHPDGKRVVSSDTSGEIRLWPLRPESGMAVRRMQVGEKPVSPLAHDRAGNWLGVQKSRGEVALWDLRGPADQDPLMLRGFEGQICGVGMHPEGTWIATATAARVALWPLSRPYPHILRGHEDQVRDVAFSPDGNRLYSVSVDGTIRQWSLTDSVGHESRVLFEYAGEGFAQFITVRADPLGHYLLVYSSAEIGWHWEILDLKSLEITRPPLAKVPIAISLDGRLLAQIVGEKDEMKRIRLYDLETGTERFVETGEVDVGTAGFMPDGRLAVNVGCEIRAWNLEDGNYVVLVPSDRGGGFRLSRDGRFLLTRCNSETPEVEGSLFLRDLENGTSQALPEEFKGKARTILHPKGTYVAAMAGDTIWLMSTRGKSPHLLLGHEEQVNSIVFDPRGRWLASAGKDGTIRLWPLPEGEPLHRLPYEELLAKLRSQTNLRALPDSTSNTGYRIGFAEFTGWEDQPTW